MFGVDNIITLIDLRRSIVYNEELDIFNYKKIILLNHILQIHI